MSAAAPLLALTPLAPPPGLLPVPLVGLLLAGALLALLLLPMLPALLEWWRPTDTQPLPIDAGDALDPPHLASGFAQRLVAAVSRGETRLGRSRLAEAPAEGPWPLRRNEQRRGRSVRVWHRMGHLQLPDKLDCLGEVAATGDLRAASGRIYRALWSGGMLRLGDHSALLRWAHARQVEVADGCRLAGRVSADRHISLWGRCSFTLLHAPAIGFGLLPPQAPTEPVPPPLPRTRREAVDRPAHCPPEIDWDARSQRGLAVGPAELPGGSTWRGDLVGRSDLRLGPGCIVDGSLKANGWLQLEAGTVVSGGVVATQAIELGAHSIVWGPVMSEQAIVIGQGCVLGTPERPTSVTAPLIDIAPGVVVHGTVWATTRGLARRDSDDWQPQTAPPAPPEPPGKPPRQARARAA